MNVALRCTDHNANLILYNNNNNYYYYSEVIMRNALEDFEGTIKIGGRSITNLRYADDIVLVGSSIEELQNIVNRVHKASNQGGLYLNTSKTKVMKIIRDPVRNEQDNIIVNGQDIENVKNFVYLGAMITENYDDSKGIKRRIAIAKNAMISLVKVWKDRAISITKKKRLLNLWSLVLLLMDLNAGC